MTTHGLKHDTTGTLFKRKGYEFTKSSKSCGTAKFFSQNLLRRNTGLKNVCQIVSTFAILRIKMNMQV